MSDLITVKRFKFNKNETLSRYEIEGVQSGYGVEDEIRDVKVKGETAIPYGRYVLGYRQSPKFSGRFYYNDELNKIITKAEYDAMKTRGGYRVHDALWVTNVPGFEFILIHPGNTDKDTEGCYVVGNKTGVIDGKEGVAESVDNYKKLYVKVYPKVKAAQQTINYIKA